MLSAHRWHAAALRRQRGLSLVEMMVGVAIGLIVVAAASLLVSTQLGDNRRLLVETQLQQDLRASMDIVSRELRRVGVQFEGQALDGRWYAGTAEVQRNTYAAVPLASVDNVPVSHLEFRYQAGPGLDGPYGFKLDGNVIKTLMAGSGWQELTDGNVLKVTAFTVTPRNGTPIVLPCPRLCPDGSTDCWPRLQVRDFNIAISAEAISRPDVKRTLLGNVRLRNDIVLFDPVTNQICPP